MQRFLLESGLLLVVQLLDVARDGACFFHCIIAVINAIDTGFPNNSDDLRRYLCENLRLSAAFIIPGLGMTPLEYFDKEYSRKAKTRQYLRNSHYNDIVVGRGENPLSNPLFVNNFEEYLFWMEQPNTHVDGLMVAFAAFYLKLDLTIYTRALSEVQLETSDIPEVMQLISMGFSKSAAEQVLTQTQGNVEVAIEKLLQMDVPASAPSEAKQDVWHEQPYPCESGIKISIILDGGHFQLIVPDQEPADFSSDVRWDFMSAEAAEPTGQQSLQLPEISDVLLEEPQSVQHTQVGPSCDLITSSEQFYNACLCALTVASFPFYTNVPVEFNSSYLSVFWEHLFGSLQFVEHNCVRYRVVSFTMQDGLYVPYHGPIANLSKSTEKHAFFSQLFAQIQHQNVVSVNIAQLI
jgi:hypothetical protein